MSLLLHCQFGNVTHCLQLDQNVVNFQTLVMTWQVINLVPNLAQKMALPNFGKRFAQPLELHFLQAKAKSWQSQDFFPTWEMLLDAF